MHVVTESDRQFEISALSSKLLAAMEVIRAVENYIKNVDAGNVDLDGYSKIKEMLSRYHMVGSIFESVEK